VSTKPDSDLIDSLSALLHVTPQTAEEIWSEFFPRMLRLARRKLADLPRRESDEEDVAQSALKSFFRGRELNKFDRLDSRDEMWRLLATITARKAIRHRRRHLSQKRGGGGVRGESLFEQNTSGESSAGMGLAHMRDERKMPETTEQILLTCEDLLGRLGDDNLRKTAVLRLEGYTNQEIATELNCSVARTKQRLQRIRELWQDELPDEKDPLS
jgi:RNA polymerase sigma factor (sigma-70 family)